MREDIIQLLIAARKKGTDKHYREWIQGQPSCISGRYDYTDAGVRCEAAHVRRAGESGIGCKAEYACVPLTRAEHQIQHQKGEGALFNGDKSNLEAKQFFDEQRIQHLRMWVYER